MLKVEKRNPRNLLPIFLTYFLDNFGLGVIYPIFTPLFLQPDHPLIPHGTTYLTRTILLGLLIAAFPLAQFFGAPLIGQFSDRFGRKKAFFITILGTAIGYTFTAYSLFNASLIFLFISRFCTGLFAGNLTLCLATIADMSHDEHTRTKNFGQIAAVGGLSFILAIAFGGFFSNAAINHHFNPSIPFWIIATLSYLNLFCMIFLFHETHITKPRSDLNVLKGFHHILAATKTKELRTIYLVNFLFMLGWVASMQFLPAYLIEHFAFTPLHITFAFMGVGAVWSFSNLFINRPLAQRFYPAKTLLICLLLLGTLLASIFFVNEPSSFFLIFFPGVCCAALSWTNGLASVSLKAPLEMQGGILGINQSITSIAAMLSPTLGGFLFGISKHGVYIFSGIICLTAFYILWHSKTYLHQIKISH